MAVQGTVYEVILIPEAPHGAGLSERLLLIGRSFCLLSCQDTDIMEVISRDDCQHILRIDLEPHRTLGRWLRAVQKNRISSEGKTGIEVQSAVIVHQASGVELERFVPLSDRRAVLILHIAVEFVLAGRFVADRDGNHLRPAHEVVQVIPSIGSHHHIRRGKTVGDPVFGCGRILLSPKNHAMVRPVAKVAYRGRPADIISQTEINTVKKIVRSVHVNPAVHNVGLRVRNIFPTGQIWVKGLFL